MKRQAEIEKIKKNLKVEIANVYVKHKRKFLYHFQIRLGLEKDFAEDILSETMMTFQTQIENDSLTSLNCNLKTYLISIGRNIMMNRIRKEQKLEYSDNLDSFTSDIIEFDKELDLLERDDIIWKMFDKLSDSCQDVIWMWIYKGWSNEQIAKALGYDNILTFNAKKKRCKRKIKEMMLKCKHFER
ncbi:MAG: sigma-70 family RNA polymerase sigma factor [Bacteroidales bacterium]|nr:sigma-70 family RNA polymerase sigma factor [Bacteroidales bacterium]MCF8459032.1 sigma-70 family RNA polymerase sigma factor [Bacteroidales bacterium]